MIYGGIDVAKHSHEVCLVNESGDIVLKMHIDNNHKGMNKLLQALKRLGLRPDDVKFCLEATGHYWLPIYCYLTDLGFKLHVINPIQSDALRNLYVRKTKTDQKDALLLADLLRLGRAPETRLPSETTLKLQSLSRLRFEFIRQVGSLKNRVLGILDRIFPEYPGCFSDVFIRTSKELLKSYPTPEELAEVDLSELSAFLKEHSRGRFGEERAKKIQSLAKGTFGITIALDAFTLQLRLLIEQIEFIEEQIKVIEDAINEVMEELRPSKETPYRHVIETIPGIGPVLAAAIIGEIGDISRFPNPRALVAYAGLDATVRASGLFEGTRNRMSKRGSPVLRNSLWLAAVSARRFNPELKAYYELKRSQGKHLNVATGAVARKLVHLIYSLWKDNRPYDPDYQWSPPGNNA
ncbi:IS110 family transposase [Thermovenabulum sp.]|uniref:IS110 family transposase n=1 Tax=Thermovenabulum sp. TaxID=3100335 RepID=UPI003C7997C1